MNQDAIQDVTHNLGEMAERIESKRVLISGGAGFLGSWMCDLLIALGAEVVCIDNMSSGREENVGHLLDNGQFTFIQGDITGSVEIAGSFDMVMHLASPASPFEFMEYPVDILKANTLGIVRMLEIARKSGARFLFSSTSEIYGDSQIIPTPEEYWGNVNPVGQRSCYDEAKRCGEAYAMAYVAQYGLDVRIARIFNTYGPRMRADGIYGRVIPRFIRQALSGEPFTVFGDGSQTRSFCYVTDQIEGLLRLAFMNDLGGERIFNIGSEDEITIQELAEVVKQATGSSSPVEYHPLPKDDPRRRRPDILRAREVLGWEPKVGLKKGINRTIEFMKL